MEGEGVSVEEESSQLMHALSFFSLSF